MQLLRLANEDQTVIIDLLRAPFGLRAGWDTQTPPMGGSYTYEPYGAQFAFGNYQPVSESFELAIKGRPSVVLTAMDSLQDFLESIRLFHSGDLAAKSCWLEWQADCDENPKRTLLYSGMFRVTSEDDVTPSATKSVIIGRLTLTRHPLWETTTSGSISGIGISTTGGKQDYVAIPGNVPARIGFARFGSGTSPDMCRFWMGVRRFNQGVSGFIPVWECEWGTAGTDCGAAILDATASPEHLAPGTGARRRVTYVTTTLQPRLTITINEVLAGAGAGTSEHFQGRYLVLLRCKVSAAGTSGIQLRSGYTGNVLSEEVYIDNTNWQLIPLGDISISPWKGNIYSTAGFFTTYRLDIYAEQLTAGHNLDLDCLILIPNEHLLTIDGADLDSIIPADFVAVRVNEDDTEVAYGMETAMVDDSIESGTVDWYLPSGAGTIILAVEDPASHTIGEFVDTLITYYPRWLLYRTD